MLQKYKFIDKLAVHTLQKHIECFFKKIKGSSPKDPFDPDIYCPAELAKKAKRKITKKVRGKNIQVNNDLYKKLLAFFDKYKSLGRLQNAVDDAFNNMNKISSLLSSKEARVCVTDLPVQIQIEAKRLFIHLYENTLSSYGIKQHYQLFCGAQENIWCPFCGMEKLEDYTYVKEDYDHLLAKSIYPFASINMNNLAPMCKKCNRTHKKDQDLIWDGVNQIKAINPYTSKLNIKIDFAGSTLPNIRNKKGNWILATLPNREEVIRWNTILKITDRIEKDYFIRGKRPDLETWITDFTTIYDQNPGVKTVKQTRDALNKFGNDFENDRHKEGRYVKASIFKWIASDASDVYIQSILNIIIRKTGP